MSRIGPNRAVAWVHIGDTHAGSKLAPLVNFTDADGVNYSPSRLQAVLNGYAAEVLSEVKALVKGHDVVVGFGGDLVDGVSHHGTTQTIGNHNDQRDLAVELLRPWLNMAGKAYGLLGTDAHVGDNGQQDTSVCKELGVEARHHWRIETAGRLLDWAHHISGNRRFPESAALNLAKRISDDISKRNREIDRLNRENEALPEAKRAEPLEHERIPDMIVRHHMHVYAATKFEETQSVIVPGWQAQTSYTRKLDPAGLLSVGVVVWWPGRGEVRPVVRHFPSDEIVRVDFAKAKAPARAAA